MKISYGETCGFKNWIVQNASKPHAVWILFWIAFIEASCLPLSVDVVFITLGVIAPRKSFYYAFIAIAGSVLGGYAGYAVGYAVFETMGQQLLNFFGIADEFGNILHRYRQHGIEVMAFSGFVPIPYLTFTYAAGFVQTLDLITFSIGSLIGRSIRFLTVGILLYIFGSRINNFFEKRFYTASVVLIVLVIFFLILYRLWIQK